ncbi:hypothetical protein Y025_4069 [Burkholderia pseudomallei TSV32]|nr:hypothetical protein Y025_4069 [Burkholderia pseudomallei TSV32]
MSYSPIKRPFHEVVKNLIAVGLGTGNCRLRNGVGEYLSFDMEYFYLAMKLGLTFTVDGNLRSGTIIGRLY